VIQYRCRCSHLRNQRWHGRRAPISRRLALPVTRSTGRARAAKQLSASPRGSVHLMHGRSVADGPINILWPPHGGGGGRNVSPDSAYLLRLQGSFGRCRIDGGPAHAIGRVRSFLGCGASGLTGERVSGSPAQPTASSRPRYTPESSRLPINTLISVVDDERWKLAAACRRYSGGGGGGLHRTACARSAVWLADMVGNEPDGSPVVGDRRGIEPTDVVLNAARGVASLCMHAARTRPPCRGQSVSQSASLASSCAVSGHVTGRQLLRRRRHRHRQRLRLLSLRQRPRRHNRHGEQSGVGPETYWKFQ
jgi:hypothetical protein